MDEIIAVFLAAEFIVAIAIRVNLVVMALNIAAPVYLIVDKANVQFIILKE
jgi:hypothetical protein